jgi:DNA-binding transcriptional LysR family regulator
MDFRLKVFFTVATRLSFTKAATELFITTCRFETYTRIRRAIQSQTFNTSSKISLTQAGEQLVKHAKSIFEIYREIDFEMSALIKEQYGLLRLGASTTISIPNPAIISSFPSRDERYQSHLRNGNTEQIENALLDKKLKLVL